MAAIIIKDKYIQNSLFILFTYVYNFNFYLNLHAVIKLKIIKLKKNIQHLNILVCQLFRYTVQDCSHNTV